MPTKKISRTAVLWPILTTWALAIVCLVVHLVLKYLVSRDPNLAEQTGVQAGQTFSLWLFVLFSVIAAGLFVVALISWLMKTVEYAANAVDNLRSLRSGQTQLEAMLTQLSENMLLSDAIKTIAFREKDRAVLEDAIHQDIQMGKFGSADLLIKDLASRFGSPEQAEKLRQEMTEFRSATIQEKITKAIARIEQLWSIHHYSEAEKQVGVLQKIYPQNEKVQSLTGQTQRRLEEHKKELLSRWDESIKANQVDKSIEILELLDNYLTPTEAAALEESARGVFRAKLHNLGVQFSMFVTERKWDKALQVGREITEEYPNSRMAQEVREKIPALEQRATS